MEDFPASHPLYGSEQSKSGFGICYQFAIKCPVSVSKTQCFQGFAGFVSYSHSIVEIVRILDNPYGVAEVKFLDVVVDDSGNGYFTYLLKTKKTMNASLKYLKRVCNEDEAR